MKNSTKKRILVFGCSKAGKTSMLNTITGQNLKVSDAAVGTTFETQIFKDFQYNGKIYQFIDTAGLDEGDKGTISSGAAILNLINFIRNEDGKGFNLFIMVMAKGVISQAIQKNYELFINCTKAHEIPTLCVVTKCDNDIPLNKWVDENKGKFEKQYKMKFEDMIGSCFAQERDGRLGVLYEQLCNESKEDVLKMIEKTCSERPYSIIHGGILPTIKKIWNRIFSTKNSTKKRILVFGCSKAGKTSMLNTITGQNLKVSDAAVGTTFETQIFKDFQYNGKIYQFIDTAGLDEGDKGTISSGAAILNLINFIRNEDGKGFNLFIMVMAKSIISQAIEKNYELFINCIKAHEIPTLCVVTRCENDIPFSKWVVENKGCFEKQYKMKFDDMIGSCFAQERDGRLGDYYKHLCNESKEDVLKMIEKTCSERPYSIIHGGILPTIKKIWNRIASLLNLPKWLNGPLYAFLKAMGINDAKAMKVAIEVRAPKHELQNSRHAQ